MALWRDYDIAITVLPLLQTTMQLYPEGIYNPGETLI